VTTVRAMPDKTNSAETSPDNTVQVIRDLRAYADAGMDPVFASKLLAVAAELEALTATPKSRAA
jgi:hypothetical protein